MMDTLEYSCLLLKRRLKSVSFQIWSHNSYSNKTELIFSSNHQLKTAAPQFADLPPGFSTYNVHTEHDKVAILFYYPQGNRIGIYLFHYSNILTKEDIEELYYLMHSFELEKIVQARNKELKTMVDSIGAVTSSLDLHNVLERIISSALKVIPDADAGYLMLYDPDTEKLIPKAQVGFNDSLYQFKINVGESVTGKVFEDGRGRIYNTKQDLLKEMYTNHITDENFNHITQSTQYFPEGAMCVPVAIGEERIGIMIIHQWKIKRKITEQDLYLLQGFAGQAGIAIQNAQFHAETELRLHEITLLSNQLQKKNTELQQRYEVHEKLTTISLKNKGVNFLIDALNKMIKNSLMFFNSLENTFYSPDTLPADPFSPFEIKSIFSDKFQPVFAKTDAMGDAFYLFPIYNRTIFLGCLVIEGTDSLSKADQITLEQGSSILALELVKIQSVTSIYYRKTHEQFQELLAEKDPEQLMKKGEELGLHTSSYWAVAILEIPKFIIDLQYLDMEIYQLVSKINTELFTTKKLIYGHYNKIILLISLHQPDDMNCIYEKLHSLRKEKDHSDSPPFRGGVSNAYKGVVSIRKCYEESNKTLDYLANRNSTNVIRYEDIGLNRLFLNQSAQEIDQFIHEVFSAFSSKNGRHKDLEKTLFTYMELNRSANKTAELLHVHINTLYQRLKKIEDLLDVDLNNNEDTLKIQLACHLKKSQISATRM